MIKINQINFVDQSRDHPQVAIMDIKSGASELKSSKLVPMMKKISPKNASGRD